MQSFPLPHKARAAIILMLHPKHELFNNLGVHMGVHMGDGRHDRLVLRCVACSVANIPGASVEHNKFCVSVHFRNCPFEVWQQVCSQAPSSFF